MHVIQVNMSLIQASALLPSASFSLSISNLKHVRMHLYFPHMHPEYMEIAWNTHNKFFLAGKLSIYK